MEKFHFKKPGVEFTFKNLIWDDEERSFLFKWKAVGSDDREFNIYTEDGYFGHAKVDLSNKRIFCSFKLNKKEMKGVSLPENIFKEIKSSCEEVKANFIEKFNRIVNEIVIGKKSINFSIVGCDYPHYHAWIDDTEGLKNVQAIMEEAIKRLTGETYISNSCDYIKYRLKQDIAKKSDLNKKAFNLIYNTEVQKYHNFDKDIVTSFDMNLSDALKLHKYLENKNKKEEKVKNIFEKAKITGTKQFLNSWSEPCNNPHESCDIDNVVLYAMPDGSQKLERYHTW